MAELSGTSLRFHDKIADVASLVACTLPVSNATVLLKGVSGNNTRLSSNNVESGKNTYALYRLGPVKLSRNSSLEIGNRIIPLGDYWNENTKDMRYEVWLSLKSTSDNAYCDRVFLVQPNIASE